MVSSAVSYVRIFTMVTILYAGCLVPTWYTLSRLGGGAAVDISCSDCGVTVLYSSAAICEGLQRHTVVSLVLRLATFIMGMGFTGYHKLLMRYLGMHAVAGTNFFSVIEMAYPHVQDIIDDMCDLGKEETKLLPAS